MSPPATHDANQISYDTKHTPSETVIDIEPKRVEEKSEHAHATVLDLSAQDSPAILEMDSQGTENMNGKAGNGKVVIFILRVT